MPQSLMQPLSIGNIVSMGLAIYRSHFKTYLQLALLAALWSLVPIYGWAKSSTIAGTISRLAFKDLISQPESVNTAREYLKPRLWGFFSVSLLVGLIFAGAFIAFYILLIILILISVGIIQAVGSQNPVGIVILILLVIAFFAVSFTAFIRIFSRLLLADLPLAIEEDIFSTKSISRSWELTQGFAYLWRIQCIILVTFMVTLPIYIIVQIILAGLQGILSTKVPQNSIPFLLISYMTAYVLGLLGNIWILPLWQTIKAVVYYDLRSRREGMGLQIRDRKSSFEEE